MTRTAQPILLVDPDIRARTYLAGQLEPLGLRVLQANDGAEATRILATEDVRVMISELYLECDAEKCLIAATRRAAPDRELRIVAHTHRSLDEDRAWALTAGADAYLIKPTRASRVRYVVGRLLTSSAVGAAPASGGPLMRRDSLDAALTEIEQGTLESRCSIVFGRQWWQSLAAADRMAYRLRAKALRVSLRSDSEIGNHFVEIRGRLRPELALRTEQPESPYRR